MTNGETVPHEYQAEVFEAGKVVPNALREVIAEQFDIYAEIDRRNGWVEPITDPKQLKQPDIMALFGALWAEALEWCYASHRNSKLVGRRLKVIIYCVRPELLGNRRTLEKIAEDEGVTVQNISALVSKFRHHFNFVARSMNCQTGCDAKRAAALNRSKHKPKKK